MKKQENYIYTSLIYKKIQGKLNAEETRRWQRWLDEDSAHRAYFERIQAYYESCPEREISQDEIDEAWRALVLRTGWCPVSPRRKFIYRGMRIAAVLFLFVGMFWLWKVISEKESMPAEQQILPGRAVATLELADGKIYELNSLTAIEQKTIAENIVIDSCRVSYTQMDTVFPALVFNKLSIPRGGEYHLILEDGTKVWLNAESQLKYPQVFGKETREVFLKGEAYFEVEKENQRPFVVHAGMQKITVLGTSFGITSYEDENVKTTTLVKGKVKVEFPGYSLETYVLEPGDQIACNHQGIEKKKVNVYEYIAWHEGKYVFHQKRLEDMLYTLSRWYDFHVFFQHPKAKEVLFSGELRRFDNFQDILHLIQKTSDVRFEVDKNVVIVSQ